MLMPAVTMPLQHMEIFFFKYSKYPPDGSKHRITNTLKTRLMGGLTSPAESQVVGDYGHSEVRPLTGTLRA